MRGRKRKYDPTIPAHIDQANLPPGMLWDRSGKGRWYVRNPHPEGGRLVAVTVANATARLSDLHAIIEQRAGKSARGTIAHVVEQFHASTEFRDLAPATRRDYEFCAKFLRSYKTPMGATLDALQVDKLTPPAIQRLIEVVAKGKPESRPGAGDALEGRPAKANHVLRYMRRLFAWGIRHGHCTTNPAKGVKQAKERARTGMPEADAYAALHAFAQERGALKPHTRGSCPPYLAPLMELAYLCRMRSVEALNLADADFSAEGLYVARVKGSRDNVVRWNPRLRAAWDAAVAIRAAILAKREARGKARPVPIRPEARAIFVGQDGAPLSMSGFRNAWQDVRAAAILAGVIPAGIKFTFHGLKHRGITDTTGNKQQAAGHVDPQMTARYDHEIAVVEPAMPRELSGELSGPNKKGAPKGA